MAFSLFERRVSALIFGATCYLLIAKRLFCLPSLCQIFIYLPATRKIIAPALTERRDVLNAYMVSELVTAEMSDAMVSTSHPTATSTRGEDTTSL